MVPLDRGARQWMGPRWGQPERGWKDRTQSCQASLGDPVLFQVGGPTKSGGCVVVAMARHRGLQRCQIPRSVSPRITDVCEQ